MFSFIKKIFQIEKKEAQEINEEAEIGAIVVTDIGSVRTNNEDLGFFIRPYDPEVRKEKGFLGIVADGMGGHAAGEVASKIAVETIQKEYYSSEENTIKSLKEAFAKANTKIFQKAKQSTQLKGMGTTATAVAICERQLYFAHVGDSRLYLINKNGIKQISEDHTYIQSLINKGEITPDEARVHPERNVLIRAMGTYENVEVDVAKIEKTFEVEDRLLLCSDGLYDYLHDDEILKLVLGRELKKCAYELIEIAKQRGGHDNITVIIIEAKREGSNGSSKITTDIKDIISE